MLSSFLKTLGVFCFSAFCLGAIFVACANKNINETERIDKIIESKVNSSGVLTFTEDEMNSELIKRAIQRRITFSITHISDRENVIKDIEQMLNDEKETYKIVKEKKAGFVEALVATLDGATLGAVGGSFFPGIGNIIGGIVGGGTGLALSLKDYIGEMFDGDVNWLISKSPDEKILNIIFVKDNQKQ